MGIIAILLTVAAFVLALVHDANTISNSVN